MSSLSYFHALEDLERQRAALAADARVIAAFIVGWWPALEDGIDWSKERVDESAGVAPVLAAARRVLESTKEAPRPDAYDGAIALLDAMRDKTNHEETTMHESETQVQQETPTLYDAINGARRSIKRDAAQRHDGRRVRKAIGRWLWWLIRDAVAREYLVRPDCRHDWTNWSNPVETDVRVVASLFGSFDEPRNDKALVQTRQCLKCNVHERRYC